MCSSLHTLALFICVYVSLPASLSAVHIEKDNHRRARNVHIEKAREMLAALGKSNAQQAKVEYAAVADAIVSASSPHNAPKVLIFGAGRDSEAWLLLVRDGLGGSVLFLEDLDRWIQSTRKSVDGVNVVKASYSTRMDEAVALAAFVEEHTDADGKFDDAVHRRLWPDVPSDVRSVRWDVVLVDGPRGYGAAAPGRSQSIYAARVLANEAPKGHKTHVFVHDCNRLVENSFTRLLLGDAFVDTATMKRMRHYVIEGSA
jgi:glucuronoxylan 4-O-methyltransferase